MRASTSFCDSRPRAVNGPTFPGRDRRVRRNDMADIENEIREMVHRETRAWDERDAEALVSIFHPDMVWPWPPDDESHDPVHWVFPQGRFDRDRWKADWQQ